MDTDRWVNSVVSGYRKEVLGFGHQCSCSSGICLHVNNGHIPHIRLEQKLSVGAERGGCISPAKQTPDN